VPLPASTPPAGDRVVVHSTLRGLAAGVLAPTSLLIIGGFALARGGFRVRPTLLVGGGLVLTAIVLFDLPRRAELDDTGVTRVCLLRRHRLPWSQVVAIERSRPTTLSVARTALDRRDGVGVRVSGGLVARGHGRRRWLLSDAVESRNEHDRIRGLLARLPTPVMLRAPTPHASAPPTDLYRRRS
jgi:hypothetical protein